MIVLSICTLLFSNYISPWKWKYWSNRLLFLYFNSTKFKNDGDCFQCLRVKQADFRIWEMINTYVIFSLPKKKNKPQLQSWTSLNSVQTLKNAKQSCVKVQRPLWQSDCCTDFWHASFVCCRVKRAGQHSKATVNCNLSHDKELFIRGLNWLGRREDWREKFGGVGGVTCQSQGAGPRLMIVFKSKHIPQCTSPCLSYAHTDGQRKAVLMLLQTE